MLTRIRYKRMIDQLSGRKLISVRQDGTSEVYNIHRLLQQKIITDMSPSDFADVFQIVLSLVRCKYPHSSVMQIPEPDKWDDCGTYMPHVFSLHHVYKEFKGVEETEELAELFYDAGFHVWERDTTAYDGLAFLNSAKDILDNLGVDPNAKLRADIHSIMGEFYSGWGSKYREESLQQHTRALEIRQRAYETDPTDKNSDVLFRNATNDRATCLLSQNRFEEAGAAFQSCLEQYKFWGGETEMPFEYQKYYSNFALVLAWRGDYKQAVEFLRRSVDLSCRHSDKTWHYSMNCFWLGCVLMQAGDVQGALDAHLETLKLRVEVFGKHEAASIISTYAVGATYYELGDPDSAL